ncbi:site-2 protease family protein [Nitrospiraceae bacterium HYJII51-Mn-bac16s-1-B09]|uniref:Site-2 protease family protein n=2 Tax=Candidatus Manganitrophus noduliformans TaxID=2606439 RepID=A0A7X6DR85_9BACT|nr:site-2 protease family protein [Candidatus Manganitrophus noduliformans]
MQEESWAAAGEEEKTRFAVPAILFLITIFTTLLAGSYQEGGEPFRRPADLVKGIPFSFTLMSILFVHEMGHYVTSKYYGVKTTLPYFIPGPWAPFGIGTFGAFIRMRSPILRKNALLDIGAAGPIAGFVVSIFAVGVGLYSSKIVEIQEGNALLRLGDPLMFTFLAHFLGKVPPAGYDVALSSVAFAGWFGLFVTSMNLLPIGQLDGGHIAYALLGRKQRFLSIGMVVTLIILGVIGWPGWYIWAILISFLGLHHPPTIDEDVPLDLKHQLIGWGSIVLFIVTFMPVPFKI